MNELEKLASKAATQGLPFLLSGGHAVITHNFPRSTFDLDLIIRRDDRERWLRLAQDIGYELYHEGPNFLQFNAPSAESFPLDLMLVNEETFSKLRADATSNSDLELPDWSGMDDSSARITPQAAFRLCEQYPRLIARGRARRPEPAEKCTVEFVL